jgi:N-acetylneuraminate synthase
MTSPASHTVPAPPRVRVVAEIGCNHKGEFDIALDMIETVAEFCEVDVAKFQKRSPKDLLTKEEYNEPHPNPRHAYGDPYGEHREVLEFDVEQHRDLKAHCEDHGVVYSTSVWDVPSAREITTLDPEYIKIPSACNLNFEILDYLVDHYGGPIHVSLGMTTQEEEEQIVDFFVRNDREDDLILYSCTSGYPVPFEDICLLEIPRLVDAYGDVVREIGFSGHHKGIAADVSAMTLGARWVERHFTLDRTWKGTDHAASLEPGGLRKLNRDLQNVAKALDRKGTGILPIEEEQRDKLKKVKQIQ